ncbi:uncharacterized protein LOC142354377 isoform X2 [Convolutriloba macropyga]|uniref:uncharacterized protein LOC142354377 isoform X2 n=1 Tax=Convolutriloba macropyga TaxID=536237 RepID=UPI003F51B2CF
MKLNLAPVLFITAVLFLSAETTFRPEWGSLLFLIPNQLTDLGRKCATKSSHYCLDCYRTFHSKAEDGDYETNIDYDASFPTQEIVTEFGVKVAEIYEKINFFSDLMSENCCEDQTAKYILHGYMNRNMTPDDYLDKLTDYTDEHLGINFIGVHYDEERCLNVITEIGFGDPPFLQFPPITSSAEFESQMEIRVVQTQHHVQRPAMDMRVMKETDS